MTDTHERLDRILSSARVSIARDVDDPARLWRGQFRDGWSTQRKRMRAKIDEITETLRRDRHKSIDEQGSWLGAAIRGYFAYFAVPTNSRMMSAFRAHIGERWFQSLRRSSQRHRMTWERMGGLIDRFLPPVRVLHPWPDQRFRVTHSR